MFKKSSLYTLVAVLFIAAAILSACGTPTPSAGPAQPAVTEAPKSKLAVGIVLPTKDEPRWIQDETRFKEALDQSRLRCRNPVQPGALGQRERERQIAGDQRRQSPDYLPARWLCRRSRR